MNIYIRSMTLNDIKAVHSIDKLSFNMPWPERSYRFEIEENPTSSLWVAEAQISDLTKYIVGMLVMWKILDEAHIATLAVHPDFRGLGIAKKLISVSLRKAVDSGARLATLEVRANNLSAQKLYRNFGFEISGRRHKYYRDNNEDALIMTLNGLGRGYLKLLNKIENTSISTEYIR